MASAGRRQGGARGRHAGGRGVGRVRRQAAAAGGAQLLEVGRRAARLREGGRKGGDAARTRARKHWRHGGGTAGADGDARRGGAGAAGAGSRPIWAGWRPIAAPATTRARPGCTRRDHDGTPGRRARRGRTVTTRDDRPTAGAEPGGHPPAARTALHRPC